MPMVGRLQPTAAAMPLLPASALLLVLSACTLAGCGDRRAVATATPSAVPSRQAALPSPAAAGVGARFACDANVTVVATTQVAQVSLPDGRQVALSRIADSTPAVFTGSALYFRLDGARTFLSEESGRELACRPADARR